MIVLITGGICSGKSYVSNYIRDMGYEVIDTDKLAKQLMEPETSTYYELIYTFGDELIGHNKYLDKAKLRQIVFENDEKRRKLSSIVHPAVKKEVEKIARNYKLIFVETAIPVQAKMYDMGKIIYVHAKDEDRISRMISERHLTFEECKSILDSQAEEEKIIEVADYIIENSNGCNPRNEIDRIVMELENETL